MIEVATKYAAKNILYCVIDSGVDAAHPDFVGAKLQGCRKKQPELQEPVGRGPQLPRG